MRSLVRILGPAALAACALAGCTESLQGTGGAASGNAVDRPTASLGTAPRHAAGDIVTLSREEVVGSPADYRFRMVGSDTGPTSVYLVVQNGGREREYLVDRCGDVDTDEFLPEGLLMPIECDGRRIVLHQEGGHFVASGGPRDVRVPIPGYDARRAVGPAAPSRSPVFPL